MPTKSSRPSKTGLAVLELQKKLPKARVVYCSATGAPVNDSLVDTCSFSRYYVGASEPQNMAYMSRLGIWGEGTQFLHFDDFLKAMERRCGPVCVCVCVCVCTRAHACV